MLTMGQVPIVRKKAGDEQKFSHHSILMYDEPHVQQWSHTIISPSSVIILLASVNSPQYSYNCEIS